MEPKICDTRVAVRHLVNRFDKFPVERTGSDVDETISLIERGTNVSADSFYVILLRLHSGRLDRGTPIHELRSRRSWPIKHDSLHKPHSGVAPRGLYNTLLYVANAFAPMSRR